MRSRDAEVCALSDIDHQISPELAHAIYPTLHLGADTYLSRTRDRKQRFGDSRSRCHHLRGSLLDSRRANGSRDAESRISSVAAVGATTVRIAALI
jgi:hypothetical protein